MAGQHYLRLLVMTVLSFAAMYGLMYAMVDSLDSVYNGINQAYMAGLMAAAMVVIELAVMGAMYKNCKLNAAIIALSILALCKTIVAKQRRRPGDAVERRVRVRMVCVKRVFHCCLFI